MSKEKIIVALDVPTADQAREKIRILREEVGAFKIGLQLFTAAGAGFVREVVESGLKIFLDLKFHDIPNTVSGAAIEAARLGVWMFNVHALGGGEMMRRTIGNVRELCEKENLAQPKIIGVTVLTSSTAETLSEIGIAVKIESQVLRLAKLTAESGLDGVVASPQEVGVIRNEIKDENFLLVTPGVRSSEKSKAESKINDSQIAGDDQKRIMTPSQAIRAGSDYLVIGRPILQANDPVRAVQDILAEIEAGD